jgi:hypothetical protein
VNGRDRVCRPHGGARVDDFLSTTLALDVPDVTSDGTDSTEALEERAESADAETESIDPVPSCGFDIVAGPALYQGQPVVVAVDLRRSLAIAYLAIDCSVIDRAPLP